MSHTLYYSCVDHDPTIDSDEVGNRLSDLPEAVRDIERREDIVEFMRQMIVVGLDIHELAPDDFLLKNRWFFLYFHKKCEIIVVDEYDDIVWVKDDMTILAEDVTGHCMTGWGRHEDGRSCARHHRLDKWVFPDPTTQRHTLECLREH